MRVPIVFCFDNNFARYAYVTIRSLSYFAKSETRYSVYCIINKDLDESNIKLIKSLVNKNLKIKLINALNTFESAHQHRGITESSYYRLMLHDLLPNEDKVIYLDVDVLINNDLSELYNNNLDGFIIGAVKNLFIYQVFEKHLKEIAYWKEKYENFKSYYINAGVLLLNLKEIRATKIFKEWITLSNENWEYHDQDILNMSCFGRIYYLPPKYNATYAIRAKGSSNWGLFSNEELSEEPVIYHFTASKPWNAKYMKQSRVWWNFVKKILKSIIFI